ncbi:MAG TPA: lytic transglycosylase domain-containing protein [Rudaea sp.]|nr:lytic transglycosylase domain-containing protein [Rudaea sp.]
MKSSPFIARSFYACASLAALLFLLVPTIASAGAVYQCDGPDGQIAFTNKPSTFAHCKKVSDYADPPPAKPPTEKTAPHSEYRSETPAAGSAATPTPASGSTSDKFVEIHRGAVYKVAKANGVTEYTNVRPASGAYRVLFTYMATCFACSVHSSVNWDSTRLQLDAYRDEIAAASAEFGVDPALLRAIIHAESGFNPNAVSIKGAQGLMQLMPGTASDLGVDNPFDVRQNIRGGAQYLAGLLKQFNGNERLAAAAYDAGPQNVQKYNGVPPFDETQVYVDRVSTLRRRYHDANPPPVAEAAPAGAPKS